MGFRTTPYALEVGDVGAGDPKAASDRQIEAFSLRIRCWRLLPNRRFEGCTVERVAVEQFSLRFSFPLVQQPAQVSTPQGET
jgi:hypothetical protein